MRMSKIFLLATISLVPVSGTALAQDASPAAPPASHGAHPLRDKFGAANTTHDGHLTLAQAQAGGLPMVAKNFDAIDTDHKGFVTLADIRSFAQARRASRQQAPAAATPPAQ